MAVQDDNLDTGKLVTIGLVGALLTVAGSYYAAGIFHEHERAQFVEKSIGPVAERTRAQRDSQLASLDEGETTITEAMAAVVREASGD